MLWLLRAFGSFLWPSDFRSGVSLHLLYGRHVPVHFCSLCQRFCYSKAGPPGPYFSSSDFTIVPLLFFLGSFVNYLCHISSVDSVTAPHLNFLELSSRSILCSFNTAFTSSLRLQLLLAQSQPFWATLFICVPQGSSCLLIFRREIAKFQHLGC